MGLGGVTLALETRPSELIFSLQAKDNRLLSHKFACLIQSRDLKEECRKSKVELSNLLMKEEQTKKTKASTVECWNQLLSLVLKSTACCQ